MNCEYHGIWIGEEIRATLHYVAGSFSLWYGVDQFILLENILLAKIIFPRTNMDFFNFTTQHSVVY
jgi:hypothetical protein